MTADLSHRFAPSRPDSCTSAAPRRRCTAICKPVAAAASSSSRVKTPTARTSAPRPRSTATSRRWTGSAWNTTKCPDASRPNSPWEHIVVKPPCNNLSRWSGKAYYDLQSQERARTQCVEAADGRRTKSRATTASSREQECGRIAMIPNRVIRFRNPTSGSVVLQRPRSRSHRVEQRGTRRSGDLPLRWLRDLQLRGSGRRHRHAITDLIRGDDHVNNTPRQDQHLRKRWARRCRISRTCR